MLLITCTTSDNRLLRRLTWSGLPCTCFCRGSIWSGAGGPPFTHHPPLCATGPPPPSPPPEICKTSLINCVYGIAHASRIRMNNLPCAPRPLSHDLARDMPCPAARTNLDAAPCPIAGNCWSRCGRRGRQLDRLGHASCFLPLPPPDSRSLTPARFSIILLPTPCSVCSALIYRGPEATTQNMHIVFHSRPWPEKKPPPPTRHRHGGACGTSAARCACLLA